MKILGTGHYLPKGILSNEDLQELVDTSDEWIVSRTGIRNRHVVNNENTSDLATKAAYKAFENAGIEGEEIELILVATITPNAFVPGVAHQVLKNLQIPKAMTFDINAACTGFIYAMDVARSLMQMHSFKYALVIGAEVLSKLVDWSDRNTCVLFGDGAGAVVLEHQETKSQIMYASCTAIPDVDDALAAGGLAINNPLYTEEQERFFMTMKGQEVFKFAVSKVYESINQALIETGIEKQDIDYYVLHQANIRILDYIAKKLSVSTEKFYSNIARTGNTSAASIPIVLDEMNRDGKLKKGMKIVLTGFGAGLSYGTMVIEW